MKPLTRLSAFTFSLCLLLLMGACSVRAQVIVYDNSAGSGTNVYYSLSEYGDEIILAGKSNIISQMQFAYFGDFLTSGGPAARLRLYQLDGPKATSGDPTPGTVLYDSGTFPLLPGYQTKVFSGLNIAVPNDLTWTMQFSGMVGSDGDQAGLVIQTGATIGFSFDDFWLKTGGKWQLYRWVLYTGGNVRDFDGILKKLTSRSPDPVSAYVWSRFSTAIKTRVQDATQGQDIRQGALMDGLNGIIQGVSIYDATRFANVTLSSDTAAMVKQNPGDVDLKAMNRRLLDDAYPTELAPKLRADFAARLFSVSTTTPPQVSIRRDAANIVLEWAGTAVLQSAVEAKGPYKDVATSPNKYTFDASKGPNAQYWRLKN